MTHDPPRPLKLEEPWAVTPPLPPEAGGETDEACAPCGPVHLQDVLDAPGRTLGIEYKSWRNLRNPEDQAEIARDIAAIANTGGGAIAFGFDEVTLRPIDTDPFRTECDPGVMAALCRTFLDPAPRCELRVLRSARGERHPVLRVPAHGATPVFIRTHGLPPAALRLVEPGALYVRRHALLRKGGCVVAVESAKISQPADWMPLLRRCLRAERETLLGAIEAAIEGRQERPAIGARLRLFHDAAREAFTGLAGRERTRLGFSVLSYALELDRPETLEPAQMPELLSRAVLAVQEHIRTGPRLFDPPYRRAARPRFVADPTLGEEDAEVLETAWLRDEQQHGRIDLWRVSARGFASITRPLAEDDPELNESAGQSPGTWLSPNMLARDLAELALHARVLSRLFGSARAVAFRCEWRGLAGRHLFDPGFRWVQSAAALADQRVLTLAVPVAQLARAWPETVAQLMAPLLRLIEPDLALGPEWVEAEAKCWK